jgi:hypothetical protein
MALDLEYIENWNLWLDLKILARTLPAVIRGNGSKLKYRDRRMETVAAGATEETAAGLANIAAGIVVGKRGTACVTAEELFERVSDVEKSLCSAVHAGAV